MIINFTFTNALTIRIQFPSPFTPTNTVQKHQNNHVSKNNHFMPIYKHEIHVQNSISKFFCRFWSTIRGQINPIIFLNPWTWGARRCSDHFFDRFASVFIAYFDFGFFRRFQKRKISQKTYFFIEKTCPEWPGVKWRPHFQQKMFKKHHVFMSKMRDQSKLFQNHIFLENLIFFEK